MGADSKLTLPGDFDPKKVYWLKGATLNAWREALIKDRALPGPGLTETVTKTGRMLEVTATAAAAATTGAFLTVYTDANTGNTMLQGGTVSGGTGVITVADYVLLASGATAPADNTYVTLTISLTGTVDDDVLLPGCTVTAAVIANIAAAENVLPTLASPAGTLYVSLGEWGGQKFQSCGVAGNIYVQALLGSLTPLRG